MRVKVLEDELKVKDRDTGRLYVQAEGDVITVPDALGRAWCERGWAEDVEGDCPTGERKPGAARIAPESGRHRSKEG